MRRLSFFVFSTLATGVFMSGVCEPIAVSADTAPATIYVGGMSAGFTLKTGGAQIIGLSEVISESGVKSPATDAGIRAGDIIQKAGGIRVETIAELNEIVDKSKGKPLNLEILRDRENVQLSIQPAKEKVSKHYKIGVLVRESVAGIGTVTYIEKGTGRFGALGHSVVTENHQEMQISNGAVYECSIVGVCKGVRGKAGELRGMFINDKQLGNAAFSLLSLLSSSLSM